MRPIRTRSCGRAASAPCSRTSWCRRSAVKPQPRSTAGAAFQAAFAFSARLSAPGAAEAAVRARARLEIVDDVERRLHHGHDHELREPLQRLKLIALPAAVPAAHHQLALV